MTATPDPGTEAALGTTITSMPRARTPVTVPASRYTSPEFAAVERTRLWPRVWQLACTVDHVASPGDFFAYEVGPYSVLLVRGHDGVLRAFQNVCLHRGNELCAGSGGGLDELRCSYHRWCWDLEGRLREVPSRRGFGALRNEDYPLPGVQVGTWGPLVFVNLDTGAEPLDEFLEGVPDDAAWAGIEDFRCQFVVSTALACNWKTLIDGFSETYHVQGIHREMLPMCDDVNSPQRLWGRHGKLEQPYGVPSPRLRDRPDDEQVWRSFVEVMGARIGLHDKTAAGALPPIPDGVDLRHVLANLVRDRGRSLGLDFSSYRDEQILNMQQYNLFPNTTVLIFPDLLSVVRARPGSTPDDAVMDVFAFQRRPPGDPAPRSKPVDIAVPADSAAFGLVVNQDVAALGRAQRGLHQPGLTRLTLSGEECRIINLHRNLERFLDIAPSEMTGDLGR